MPDFEFVVEGPAVSLRAMHKNARRYQKWIITVREAARQRWNAGLNPTRSRVEVVLSNYFTEAPPDIDNIIKPILDALNLLVCHDDYQVYRVTSEKIEKGTVPIVPGSSSILVDALERWNEVVHAVVSWEEEEMDGNG